MRLAPLLTRALTAPRVDHVPEWESPAPYALRMSSSPSAVTKQVGEMHICFARCVRIAIHCPLIVEQIMERLPPVVAKGVEKNRKALELSLIRFFAEFGVSDGLGIVRIMPVRSCFRTIAKMSGYECDNEQVTDPGIHGKAQAPSDILLHFSLHTSPMLLPVSLVKFSSVPAYPSEQRIVSIPTTRRPARPSSSPTHAFALTQTQTSIGLASPRDIRQGFTGFFPSQFAAMNVSDGIVTHVAHPTIVLGRVFRISHELFGVEQLLWSFDEKGATSGILSTYSSPEQLLMVPGIRGALTDWLNRSTG